MTKALRLIEANVKLCDVIVYVLDARAPLSSLNPALDTIIGERAVIYALNKADLAPMGRVKEIAAKLTRGNRAAAAIDSTRSNDAKIVINLAKKLCAAKLNKFAAKGVKVPLRAMVLGVPNSGKSTLINNLAGGAKTITGNRPGVTRGKQWVRADDYLEVLDTPGTLYPKIEDQNTALKLAAIGSIKDEVVDIRELAVNLVGMLNKIDKGLIANRYGIIDGISVVPSEVEGAHGIASSPLASRNDKTTSPETVIKQIALKRGYLLQGGRPDTDRACMTLVDDFRKGRLGKIILD